MVGQKYAQPAVASIVMSMESVFAVLAGCFLLQETMTVREMTGCVLMFASVIAANVPNFFRRT
jgi:drug/metabolite transporter (DMT)-like permease